MRIFLYILRDYLKFVAGAIFLCTFLFILFDFIQKSNQFLALYKPSTYNLIKLYIYQIPFQVSQTLPIAALLGSVICMLVLSRTNEITAMRAAGMGPWQIGFPIAFGGGLLSALSIISGDFVVPFTASRMHYIEKVLIQGETDAQVTEGARWVREGQHLYNFKNYDPVNQVMNGVRIVETDLSFRPIKAFEAELGTFDTGKQSWNLENIKVLHFEPDGEISAVTHETSKSVTIPLSPKDLRKEYRQPEELGIRDLYRLVEKGKSSGVNVNSPLVDLHVKFAFHFAAFVVSIIGIKFAFRSERSVESVKSILVAIAIGMSYWIVMTAMRGLGKQGIINPIVAAWSANIVIILVGFFEVWRVRKA